MALIRCDLCDAKCVPGTIASCIPGEPKVCFICQGDEFDPYGELDHGASAGPSVWETLVIVACAAGQGAVVLFAMFVACIWISVFDDPAPPACKAGSVAAIFTNCEVAQ